MLRVKYLMTKSFFLRIAFAYRNVRVLAPKCGKQEQGEEETSRISRMVIKTQRLSLKPARH